MRTIFKFFFCIIFFTLPLLLLYGDDNKVLAINYFKSHGNHANKRCVDLSTKLKLSEKDIYYLKFLTDIETLHLDTAKNINNDTLKIFSHFNKLAVLNLGSPEISNEGLLHLSSLTKIEILSLINANITDDALKSLSTMTKLSELSLNNTKINGTGLQYIKHLKLTSLTLINTQVSDDTIKYIYPFKNLESLSIEGTKVTKEGIKQLKKMLPHCRVIN